MINALPINMYILPVIILYVYLGFVVGTTTNITRTRFLTDPESLTSNDSTFRIGFFSPVKSTSRYVGIWYNSDPESNMLEVIWVANRDNPLNDSSGVLRLSVNGDLQVIDGNNTTFWSSNTTTTTAATATVVAQLLDTGNLVLISNPSGLMIWQSFEHPTDSWLPSVKFTVKQEKKENPMLHSWKTDSDPSIGSFRFGIVPRTLPEFFTLKGDKPYWRSGPWNGYLYIGIPNMNSEVSTGFNIIDDHEGSLYVAYSVLNRSILERYMMNFDGLVLQKDWDFAAKRWVVKWQSIGSECDVYGKCGAFGICDPTGSPICRCLTGFRPRKVEEWRQGNWTSGCARTAELHCDSTEKKEDVFLRLQHMKVPDYSEWISANDQGDCGNKCLGDCLCLAYAYYSGIGCMIWNRSLIDIQQFSGDGADLFIRLAYSALSEHSSKWRVIVGVLVIMSSAVFVALMYFIWRRMNQRRGLKSAAKEKPNTWHDNIKIAAGGRIVEFGELPLFNLEKLLTATKDFSEGNKLGQGGFGPVYKGELEDGQQIAVKRLSKASGQGIEEFMNEVVVISKLQHKNLVRLLGSCVEGEEKLLVYEYMPNKSLDSFLFDSRHKEQLDWEKRLNIIKGICRGLLYLHKDSRLRIIHRDLKASNILLDEGLDPKISDFGMAKIFYPKQDHAKTLRIAGTYGYMSPEYAMEGRFSEKSDVYSLGVLLLEIVSGKKNYFLYDETLNLLAYAWKLWNENEMLSFIDQKISDPSCQEGILRCIQLGLLCVQELPHDRPNVSTLLYLLDNNAMVVPDPKQPGFTQVKTCTEAQDGQECSVNDVTVTAVSSR